MPKTFTYTFQYLDILRLYDALVDAGLPGLQSGVITEPNTVEITVDDTTTQQEVDAAVQNYDGQTAHFIANQLLERHNAAFASLEQLYELLNCDDPDDCPLSQQPQPVVEAIRVIVNYLYTSTQRNYFPKAVANESG